MTSSAVEKEFFNGKSLLDVITHDSNFSHELMIWRPETQKNDICNFMMGELMKRGYYET